jgi:hypothetical protein
MRRLFAVLLCGCIFSIGCAPKIISIVDSSNVPFATIKAESYTILPYKIGIVFNEAFNSKIAKASETYRDTEYIFEARLGQDMSQALPGFLKKNFQEVIVLKSLHDAGPDFDYVLVPDISRSKANIIVRMSTVPIYELTVSLKVNVFRSGHQFKHFSIIETKGMEVPRKIKKVERQKRVQEGYDKLMTRIYMNLGKALRQL